MHKWNVLRKTAPFVLSVAVAVSGMPVTALAEDGFGDEMAIETSAEEADESVLLEAASEDAEVFDDGFADEAEAEGFYTAEETVDEAIAFTGEESEGTEGEASGDSQTQNAVEVAGKSYTWKTLSEGEDAAGLAQIGETGVYADAEALAALAEVTYYGKAALSYTEFYAGDTARESYDAVTSATSSKYSLFPNEDISEVTEAGYSIYGVKNVNVAVNAREYVEAQILKAAGCLPETGVYAEAAGIVLNEDAVAAAEQYKTLKSDGTYGAMKQNVAQTVTDAEATLLTSSRWGDYVIEVKENSTANLRNTREDTFNVNSEIQGVILTTSDGTSVGLRYTNEIWVQTYEVAFSKDLGLAGKTITEIKYIMPDSTYVYTFDGIYVKQQPAEGMAVAASFADESTVAVNVPEAVQNPRVSVYYVTGSGRQSVTTYMVQDAALTEGKVAFDAGKISEPGKVYTVKVTSDNYADMTTTAARTEGTAEAAGKTYTWKLLSEDDDKTGLAQIGETGVYADAEAMAALAEATYYGKVALSYTEFYAGDTARESYDAVTSATSSKYSLFPNEDISEVTEAGYQIYGVKNVNVAVNARTYVEAKLLAGAGRLPESGVYAKAAGIVLNENAAAETPQYKTLKSDGTYGAMKQNVAQTVTDAKATLLTSSRWGDYVIEVKENSTANLRNTREDTFNVNSEIQGVILTTSDGTSVGLRYTNEIWVQTYEVAFSKDLGLAGKTITEIKYIMPDSTYVYTFDGIYVKQQPAEGMAISAAFENETTVKVSVPEAVQNPKVSVYYVTGSGRQSVTTYMVQNADLTDGKVTFDSGNVSEEGKAYTVLVTSDNYADMTTSITGIAAPTVIPTEAPSPAPTEAPSPAPTEAPDEVPTVVPTEAPTPTPAPSLKLEKKSVVIYTKGTTKYTIKPVLTGISGKVTYTSSNKKVATVSKKGVVTAKKKGTAKITVKCGSYKATLKVTVKNPTLKLKKSSATIKVKKTVTIKATAKPAGKITYKSSNRKVAKVTSKGVVKGFRKGTATITVKCNGVTKKFKVKVK